MTGHPKTDPPLAREVMTRLADAFEPARDPARAAAMRAYLRDQFAFLGIASPDRVALTRGALAGLARPTAEDLDAIARACWARDEREYQYAACWYLRRHVRVLDAAFIPTARELITTKSWWDTVDDLAHHVVGVLVLADPGLVAVMDTWLESDDLWLARTAILHQNPAKERTDPERLFRYCERRAADSDFFIRKAIGWALREYSKTDAEAVRRFVREHDRELSGLSTREALKWLDRRAASGEN